MLTFMSWDILTYVIRFNRKLTMPSVNRVKPLRLAATHEAQDLLVDVDDASLITSCRIGSIVGLVEKTSPSKATCSIQCRASLHPQPLEISVDGQLFVKTDHTIKCVAAPSSVRAEPGTRRAGTEPFFRRRDPASPSDCIAS